MSCISVCSASCSVFYSISLSERQRITLAMLQCICMHDFIGLALYKCHRAILVVCKNDILSMKQMQVLHGYVEGASTYIWTKTSTYDCRYEEKVKNLTYQ